MVVEPDPGNFMFLEQNLACFSNVKKKRVALAAQNGEATFYRLSSNGGHLLSPDSTPEDKTRDTFVVKTQRLPELFPSHWRLALTWLKLDIEGAEYAVFNDMLTSGLKPVFVSAELHDYFHAGGELLVQQLRAAGYKVRIEGSGTSGNVCRQVHAFLE